MDSTAYLIIHGHFHQPPRENPSTGEVPKDNVVVPYLNWNEKIYNSTYKANAFSRYLSPSGKIISINNNYRHISFNFSPTLLNWIKEKHPTFLSYLIDADKYSLDKLGHGNAIAESFSHTILPLDEKEDARIEIEWGLRHFENTFGRKAEGFWLPDMAVNKDIIDFLVTSGIKFIILSPRQVGLILDMNGKIMPEEKVNTSEPFYVEGRKERIAAFFYNDKLSEDVGYKGLLKSADKLLERIRKEKEKNYLVQIVTDGEAFGHLEPYGDMALSALEKKVLSSNDIEFTNYGKYLDHFEIKKTAVLTYREGSKDKPFSSFHIIRKDEEKTRFRWKENYRQSLNILNKGIKDIISKEVISLFSGRLYPSQFFTLSSDFVTKKENADTFFSRMKEEYSLKDEEKEKLLKLIWARVYMNYAFTSASFANVVLDTPETRLSIKNACYAVSLLQNYQEKDILLPFFEELRKIKSELTDGMQIAESQLKGLSGEVEAVIFFYLNRIFATEEEFEMRYGKFALIGEDFSVNKDSQLSIVDTESLEEFRFRILSSSGFELGMSLYLTEESSYSHIQRHKRVTYDDIPPLILSYAASWIDNTMNQVTYNELSGMSRSLTHYSLIVRNRLYMPMETELLENLGIAIKIVKSFFVMTRMGILNSDEMTKIGVILDFINKNGRKSERSVICQVLSAKARSIAKEIRDGSLDNTRARMIIALLSLARSHGFEPESTDLQDVVYRYYTGELELQIDPELGKKVFSELNFEER